MNDSNNFYEVENIIDRRIIRGRKEYLIKWKGYPESQSTWEPINHLRYIQELVKRFNEKYDNKNINSKDKNKEKKEKEIKEKINKEDEKDIKKKEKKCDKEEKEKDNKLLGKKRKLAEKKLKEVRLNKNEEAIFQVDQSLEKILAIKLENKKLIAVVERKAKEGATNKEIMTTEDLKKTNPWILIDYYENKIRFA